VSAASTHKLKQVRERLQGGDIAGAQYLCEQILRSAPRNPDALSLLAMSHLMSGRPADAVPLLEQAISADARNGMALEHLGLAHLMQSQFADAESVLRRAAALPGAPASVAMRLGVSLLNQEKYEEAIRHLKQALAHDPQNVDGRLNLGRALAQTGDAAGARKHFDAVLQQDAGQVDAVYNLGVLALQLDRLDEAQAWFDRVLVQVPVYVDAIASLGIVLQKQGRLAEARERFARALEIAPDLPAAHEGMALVSLASGRTGEAVEHLRALLRADARNHTGLASLAEALFELGRLDEAAENAQRLCELDPGHSAGYATLANVYIVRGQVDRAIATLEAGYAATGSSGLLGMLTYQLRQACDWTKWWQAWEKLAPEIEHSAALGSPFWLLCEPTTAQQQLTYTQHWAEARFKSVTAPRAASVTARRHSRIRVGYLSSDLQEHAAAYLIAEVLELHDRDRFEVFAYSHGPDDGGAMRRRLQAGCEHFIDIAWEPDDVAAERIRHDELDILVDLKGYTAGDRLTIMARRPCSVQVTWLGYPGTTGARFIDYLIADPFLIPSEHESAYSERIVRMPHCYQPNDRKRQIAAPLSRAEYGIPEDAFVFCCFNQTYKITPEVFGVWMALLRDIPGSVLWLLESNRWARQNLLQHAQAEGVSAERLVFAQRLPYAGHLARYKAVDLALDTFPYTSHTILSDALWCGCPTVALCGDTFASRVSGSLLTAAALPDLVTYNLVDYEGLANRLATEPPLLREVSARVARARDHSPLFDSTRFIRDLEQLYIGLLN
jgi:predicted O-linked N-acetylglucosamine transferase (SPINDLY family)